MYPAIVILSAVAISAIALLLFRKKSDKAFGIFMKTLTLVFLAVAFFRLMLSDAFIFVEKGIWTENGQEHNAWWQLVLRWGFYLNYGVLPMAIFFNSRLFKNIAAYVCLPFTILSAFFVEDLAFLAYLPIRIPPIFCLIHYNTSHMRRHVFPCIKKEFCF